MTNRKPAPRGRTARQYETKAQLAERLQVSADTIDQLRADGVLTAYRPGGRVLLFDSAEVDAAILASAAH